MARIFISYRRVDSEGYAGRIYDQLLTRFERKDIFIDVNNLEVGRNFVQEIQRRVEECEIFIVVIGPQWLTVTNKKGQRRLHQEDDFVRLEVATALELGKTIIPVLIQQAAPPTKEDLPDELKPLSELMAFEVSHLNFVEDAAKLLHLLTKKLLNYGELLVIFGQKNWTDPILIHVDNELKDTVENSRSESSILLPAGIYNVHASIAIASTPTITVEIFPGKTAKLLCKTIGKPNWTFWGVVKNATLTITNTFLSLEKI